MAITKISDEQLNSEKRFHKNLDDIPGKSADGMKEFMDYVPRQVIIPKINEIADEVNKILPESEASSQYAYTIAQTDELLSKKADKDELTPINESLDTKVNAEFVEQKIIESKPVDYIVEQGTSGFWKYEKWNSGKFVCYGNNSYAFLSNNPSGSIYYSNATTIDFPSGFNEAPSYVSVTAHRPVGLYSSVVQGVTKSGLVMLIYTPYAVDEYNYNVSIYAVGRWK